jgi:hypothetical protein
MKKVIRLTEADLTKIIKRTISEMDDEDYLEYEEDYYDENEYYNLIDQAKDFLLYELGYEEYDIYEMSDDEIIEVLKGYDNKLYDKLQDIKYKKPINPDESYDSIGGLSVNDLKRAFDIELKKMKRNK